MARSQIFPSILIALDVLAGLVYLYELDWRRCVYWMAAAVLTTVVTF